MTLKHQYSTTGNHRIVELDIAGFLKQASEWCSYHDIATFTHYGVIYACVTPYFAGGEIEPDQIYGLHKTNFGSETAPKS